ncbi:Z1 domain-containing protein [Eubacterium barkeri]|uniref:Z1 domain-containing protein n=1 Tax=Eubacterium barkeri TaxID=1528 RepID=A0A1H3JTW3_EUBBA|nr:Z1 domain-containing protein [Eubacterium barkeri]SDY43363.1 Z1 domain-containing protein [Eubacterium barkeri]
MNSCERMLLDNLQSCIVNGDTILTEEDIDQLIEQYQKMSMFANMTDQEIKTVRNELLSRNSIKMEIGSLIEDRENRHKPWFEAQKSEFKMEYWDRYRSYILKDMGFSGNVVNTMDDILDKITDLLGNPSDDYSFQRRGLIIGDVQSGKTANYTGLICKAADVGYKAIVLLTGTIERLRKQTQKRLDAGFVGRDSDDMQKKIAKPIGAAKYNENLHPMSVTTVHNDFQKKIASSMIYDLKAVNGTILFVVKKNVKILKALEEWFNTSHNADGKVEYSLLLIDDESDNASVNTGKQDEDPTATNAAIVRILNLFRKASYIGFTATPFANIFINPQTDEEMEKESLFPKDYIYSLNAPDNYTGARDIFSENASDAYMIQEINVPEIENETCLPLKQKSGHHVTFIPKDMKEAINAFFIANTIRDLTESESNTHRAMLINVSRSRDVHEQVRRLIDDYIKTKLQCTLRLCKSKPFKKVENEAEIAELFNTYKKIYPDINISWEEIFNHLYDSTARIKTAIVNMDHPNALNYDEYRETGLRVIVIGGLSLSRGLTLEGLMISYFYRNSRTYDTLLQMGRWFGYKGKYKELCRIWMSEESREWYRYINEATEELRRDLKKFEDTALTPLEFGIRVRSDIATLDVTAKNKMRTAEKAVYRIRLSGEVIETPHITTKRSNNDQNIEAIKRMVSKIGKSPIKYPKEEKNKMQGYIDIEKNLIIDFLQHISVSPTALHFDTGVLAEFIENDSGHELDRWDIQFVEGTGKEYQLTNDIKIKKVKRSFSLILNNKVICISGSKQRLGSKGDGIFGLEINAITDIQKEIDKDYEAGFRRSREPNQKDRFKYGIKRNPLLSIYLIELKPPEKECGPEEEGIVQEFNSNGPLVGFGIGIPLLSDSESQRATYMMNKIAQKEREEAFQSYFEEEVDEDDDV